MGLLRTHEPTGNDRQRRPARRNLLPVSPPRAGASLRAKWIDRRAWFAVLAVCLGPGALPASPEGREPVATITGATWEDYRDLYPPSPLCTAEEIALWTCETDTQVFSLCVSPAVDGGPGSMQYRSARDGELLLVYPARKRPAAGLFTFSLAANGDAWVEFTSDGRGHRLHDSLRGASSVSTVVAGSPGKREGVECGSSQTLQLNSTLRFMHESGVWQASGRRPVHPGS